MTSHILDANVIIHGTEIELPFEKMVTVPEVTQEIKSDRAKQTFDIHKIKIQEPEESKVEEVKEKAKKIGLKVSKTDEKLIALAKELGGTLVTDDYEMQNIAEKLELPYKTFLKEGIKESKEWERVCKRCKHRTDKEVCEKCGGETKLAPKD